MKHKGMTRRRKRRSNADHPTQNKGKHTQYIHTQKQENGGQAGNTAETNQMRRDREEVKQKTLNMGCETLPSKTGNTRIEPRTLDTKQGTQGRQREHLNTGSN